MDVRTQKARSGGGAHPCRLAAAIKAAPPKRLSGKFIAAIAQKYFNEQPHYIFYNNHTMPKSKRAKVVHLTKVDKKGKELTLKLFANVRECLDQYQYCFVFSVENMRNTYLKDVRNQLPDCRFVPAALFEDYMLIKIACSSERQK